MCNMEGKKMLFSNYIYPCFLIIFLSGAVLFQKSRIFYTQEVEIPFKILINFSLLTFIFILFSNVLILQFSGHYFSSTR